MIFEAEPAEGRRDAHLDIAARLQPELEAIAGCISVERLESPPPGKTLSRCFFCDEKGVKAWRNSENRRGAQAAGRGGMFKNYRPRVAEVVRDYGMREREEAPVDSRTATE